MKILMHFRHFPVAMGRFIHWGLQDLGHEVFTVGPYSDGKIPWGPQFYYPQHKFPPNYVLPDANLQVENVLRVIPFKPDVILQAADTIFLEGMARVPNFILGTDPHVIDYTPRFAFADGYFSMQKHYATPDAIWVPYAYDKNIHKYLPKEKIEYDVVFSGLQYEHRMAALNAMEAQGIKVLNTLGLIYEDYVKAYNKGKIAFVYSSKEDLPARFWEGLAMRRLVLANRVPDLQELEFKEGEDYVGFSTIEEAVEKAKYYSVNDSERERIALNGWKKVQPHTYQERCKTIIKAMMSA